MTPTALFSLYVVTSFREYENDEHYFGADAIFTDLVSAQGYVGCEIAAIMEEDPEIEYILDESNPDKVWLSDGSHYFEWHIDRMEVV